MATKFQRGTSFIQLKKAIVWVAICVVHGSNKCEKLHPSATQLFTGGKNYSWVRPTGGTLGAAGQGLHGVGAHWDGVQHEPPEAQLPAKVDESVGRAHQRLPV